MECVSKIQKATGFWYTHFMDPIYGIHCYLVVGPSTDSQYLSFCSAEDIDISDYKPDRGEMDGCCWGPKDGSSVVMALAGFNSKDPTLVNTFVHEMFHFAHTAMSGRGQKHNSKWGEEAYAYFAGFVAEQFWRALLKWEKKQGS